MALFSFMKTSKEDFTGKRVYFNYYYSSLLFILGFTLTAGYRPSRPSDPPTQEVVSIYNNLYNIPQGFGPYFIKINRCVKSTTCTYFLMPNKTKLVKAVLQNHMTGKAYEYTLHDHLSCVCEHNKSKVKQEHYESSEREVSLAHYNKYERNNPPFILDCGQPQQRYQKIDDYHYPQYHGYKQCLPICTTDKTVTSQVTVTHWSGTTKKVTVTNDIACSYPQYVTNKNTRPDNMFNIDSKKTFFALVLLALVFLIVIIIDLTFCCRKKGFCYSLRKCVQGEEETPQVAIQPTLV